MLPLVEKPLLTDTFPPEDPHNIGARLLRQGLAVSAFASLEKFIESRFEHLTASLEPCPVPYSAFSGELKAFVSQDAAVGLLNKMRFQETDQKQTFFDKHVGRISGYAVTPASYSSFGFSPQGSNVSHEDIKKAFAAFGIKDAWGKLKAIAQLVGVNRLSLLDDYKNMGKARNSSAHDPESNIPSSNLQTNIETAILIGLAVDVLCSKASEAFSGARTLDEIASKLTNLRYAVRFVDREASGFWVERLSSPGKVVKRYQKEEDAIAGARSRAVRAEIVIRSVTETPLELV